MKKFICLIILFCLFSVPNFGQDVTAPGVYQLKYEAIPRYELPKRYIVDENMKFYPKEHTFRRFDIVFFLSIPITFFVFQNLLNIINAFNITLGNYNTDIERDNFGFGGGEWTFLIASMIMIPTSVAIYDAVYVRQYPLIPPFTQDRFKEARVNFSIYYNKF